MAFEVEAGQVFTIIGPNGAGKTTIFNLISRIYDPTDGRLVFRDEDITRVPPHEIARRGIARTFQNIELFEHAIGAPEPAAGPPRPRPAAAPGGAPVPAPRCALASAPIARRPRR